MASSEKYLKRLARRTDIEDALNGLETLTQEETRMANSQLTREVRETAATVDGSVSSIDDPEPIVESRTRRVSTVAPVLVPDVDDMEVSSINEMNRS